MPHLQRHPATDDADEEHSGDETTGNSSTRASQRILAATTKTWHNMELYFKHRAFLPSFACALLYLTVLSFSGQMVTYLLSTGYTSTQVAVARTISVGVEVLATWAGPWLMEKIGPIRAGLWFASWQSGCLLVGVSVMWAFADDSMVSASGLVGGTILSRLGLWGFDLCTQILVQEVSSSHVHMA